jgi:hypothetical protein
MNERLNRTLKQEATILPCSSPRVQQHKLDRFREELSKERQHEAMGVKRQVGEYRSFQPGARRCVVGEAVLGLFVGRKIAHEQGAGYADGVSIGGVPQACRPVLTAG